jgi:hypothetical protein
LNTGRRWTTFAAVVAITALALSASGVPTAGAGAITPGESGKRAVAHHAGGKVIRSATVTRKAPKPVLSRIGINSGEPTIGMTNDGAVFTSAIQSNTRVEVVRSTDQGKSWDIVSPKLGERNSQALTLDPYTYVDNRLGDTDSSRVYTIDLTVACSLLSFSDDNGESWITNPLACGRPVNDHHTLFSGPAVSSPTVGYPNIVYYCWNDVASSGCSKSLDGGLTFSASGTPAYPGADPDAGGFCGGLHGHGFVGDDGTVFLPKGHCGQPWLSISKDEGFTWTRVQVAKNGVADHEAGVVSDAKGNIYYTWIGRDRRPYLAVSKNGGKKWTKPMMIGAPGVKEANLPSLDVGGNGKIAFTYMGSENSPFIPCDESTEDPDYTATTWNGYMMISANADSNRPIFYSATVNNKKDPLYRGECGPGRCGAVWDFIDIVIDRGQVWAAFVDACIAICSTTGPSNLGGDGITGHFVGGPRLH